VPESPPDDEEPESEPDPEEPEFTPVPVESAVLHAARTSAVASVVAGGVFT
jgi:hypothetical protein